MGLPVQQLLLARGVEEQLLGGGGGEAGCVGGLELATLSLLLPV